MGRINWILPIVDVLFDGTADSVSLICEQILKKENYHRFQVELHGASDSFDDASSANVKNLIRLAEGYLQQDAGANLLEKMAARVLNGKPHPALETEQGDTSNDATKPKARRRKLG